MKRLKVLLPIPQSSTYTYDSGEEGECPPGTMVWVPFGTRKLPGIVWSIEDSPKVESFEIKAVLGKWELPPLSQSIRDLVDWAAAYYMQPKGMILKMILSGLPPLDYTPRKKYIPFEVPQDRSRQFPLTDEQQECVHALQQSVREKKYGAFLLDGVTGSGKTEVYYEAIMEAIRQGKQALIMLPEISLTQQWLDRFYQRFGVIPACWHSSIKKSEKIYIWQQVIKGQAPVVVGARSALLLPFQKLGLIVIDEEHDQSYKQDEGVQYNARDLAIVRAHKESATILLASATPSLESIHNVQIHKYQGLKLTKRFGSAGQPTTRIVDLTTPENALGSDSYLSPALEEALKLRLKKQEQSIIFINRRGFAPLTLCYACGFRIFCRSCSAHMVQHHKNGLPYMQCHHCGKSDSLPSECPSCHSDQTLRAWGAGIEKVTHEIQKKLPEARILTLSSDHVAHGSGMDEAYSKIIHQEVDVVIGTQMIAKGHDFPNMTLVGIVDADSGFLSSDLRACETTYQLLYQVSGRAGRAAKPGEVIIQTYALNHPAIASLQHHQRDEFLGLELANRQESGLPPYGRLASLLLTGSNEKQVRESAYSLGNAIPSSPDIMVLGPAPAALYKIKGRYRWRFLVQGPGKIKLQPYIHKWLASCEVPSAMKVTVDIDPYHFM